MKPLDCLETSDINYLQTRSHIPQERWPQRNRCESV